VVQLLCGLGLVDGGPLGGELGWCECAVGGVGPVPVVVDAPVLDDHAGLEQRAELRQVEQLVTELSTSSAASARVGWPRTWAAPAGGPCRDGARSVVWAALLDDDGPSGGFFRDGSPLEW
jgi:hypothetical protein